VSLGKINYCLKAVIEKGFIKVKNFKNSQNKIAYTYYLTPQGIEEKARITVEYIKQKILEYEAIQKELAALKAQVQDGSLEIEGITEELEKVRL
jgi:EPS-associated MarR family transcriptional regulator